MLLHRPIMQCTLTIHFLTDGDVHDQIHICIVILLI